MACTTILVGKDASYDGSTIIARNEDSANGEFCPKRFIVVKPDEQPRHYKSVLSHVEVDLPGEPLQYTAVPNADLKEGIWGEAGVNEANVAMSATETLTTNERVLGADPFVELTPAKGKEGEDGYEPEVPGGIGEEDFLTLVLPYVKTAREGVARLGALLEQYGTYEMNGVAFSDVDEIWWLETVGGHHWIAKRVPDEAYVTMPNQLGIDELTSTTRSETRKSTCAPRTSANSSNATIWTWPWRTSPRSTRATRSAPTPIPTTSTTPRAPGTCSVSSTRTTSSGTVRTPTTSRPRTTFHGLASPIAKSPSKT